MNRHLDAYLRTFRRLAGLSQAELALLVGLRSNTTISRFEELKRVPTLPAALALELIFGAPSTDIFPGVLATVKDGLHHRARDLYEMLQGDPSITTRVKLDFLEAVLSRSEGSGTDDV